MYQGRTLVVFLCMHRSARVHGQPAAPAGHVAGSLRLAPGQQGEPARLLGSAAAGRARIRSCCNGPSDSATTSRSRPTTSAASAKAKANGRGSGYLSDNAILRGRELVRRLVESGPVSGFKDPHTVLLWPFWQRVLEGFPGLRVVPLSVMRSPHKIAMSLFMRGHGNCGYRGLWEYGEALDVIAVHFKRMKAILDEWPGQATGRRTSSPAPTCRVRCMTSGRRR